MGYMASVTIRNADLNMIEADPEFGAKIKHALRVADLYAYRNKERLSGSVISNHDLYEFEKDIGRDVGDMPACKFWVSVPMHADVETVHVIHNGEQRSPFPHRMNDYRDAELIARAMAHMGYRLKDVVTGEVFSSMDALPRTAADYMANWDMEKLLNEGTTTLCVLNDGIDAIEADQELGPRLAQGIRDYLDSFKQHSEAYEAGEITGHVFAYDTIRAGNHSNPIQIACVTPPGEIDVLVMGQNWSREMRPIKPICLMRGEDKHQSHIEKLIEASRRKLVNIMLQAGFQVRSPGRSRSESAMDWNRKEWPARPASPAANSDCQP